MSINLHLNHTILILRMNVNDPILSDEFKVAIREDYTHINSAHLGSKKTKPLRLYRLE